MHFLADVWVTCELCRGRRYNQETLAVEYRGRNIADVLSMEVSTALDFFGNHPRIARPLELLQDVGLGYLQLGQPAKPPARHPASQPASQPAGQPQLGQPAKLPARHPASQPASQPAGQPAAGQPADQPASSVPSLGQRRPRPFRGSRIAFEPLGSDPNGF